jgi:type II secretory pathway pseudopilin PulG
MRLRTKRYIKLNSRGDTIIEILIVLGVLGFAFAIASATASNSLNKARTSEEHSRGLGSITSQIELLKSAVASKTELPDDKPFCLNADGKMNDDFPAGYKIKDDPEAETKDITDTTNPYPAECRDGIYRYSIQYDGTSESYVVRTRWDAPSGDQGAQQEIMSYRTQPTEGDQSPDFDLGTGSEKIIVQVKKIAFDITGPNSDETTPSCDKNATADKSGSTVRVEGPTIFIGTTNGASSVQFDKPTVNGNYKVTQITPPAGYEVCSPLPSAPIKVNPGETAQLPSPLKIRPICNISHEHERTEDQGENHVHTSTTSTDIYGTRKVYWWQHTGWDGRHSEWKKNSSPYSTQPDQFERWEGGTYVRYERVGSAANSGGPWYNRFEQWSADESYYIRTDTVTTNSDHWHPDEVTVKFNHNHCPA